MNLSKCETYRDSKDTTFLKYINITHDYRLPNSYKFELQKLWIGLLGRIRSEENEQIKVSKKKIWVVKFWV